MCVYAPALPPITASTHNVGTLGGHTVGERLWDSRFEFSLERRFAALGWVRVSVCCVDQEDGEAFDVGHTQCVLLGKLGPRGDAGWYHIGDGSVLEEGMYLWLEFELNDALHGSVAHAEPALLSPPPERNEPLPRPPGGTPPHAHGGGFEIDGQKKNGGGSHVQPSLPGGTPAQAVGDAALAGQHEQASGSVLMDSTLLILYDEYVNSTEQDRYVSCIQMPSFLSSSRMCPSVSGFL